MYPLTPEVVKNYLEMILSITTPTESE